MEAADGALTARLAGDALITAARSRDSAEYGLQETARFLFIDAAIAPPDNLSLVGEAILEPENSQQLILGTNLVILVRGC